MICRTACVEETHELRETVGSRSNILEFRYTGKKGRITYEAVAYAVTRGRDLAFFFVKRNASLLAVPAGMRSI